MSAENVNKNPNSIEGRSVLPIEWTNQHGAGGDEDNNPNKMNANFVIQFLAQPESGRGRAWDDKAKVRDGTSTNRNGYQKPPSKSNLILHIITHMYSYLRHMPPVGESRSFVHPLFRTIINLVNLLIY